jgi:hypothetical protein
MKATKKPMPNIAIQAAINSKNHGRKTEVTSEFYGPSKIVISLQF